MGILLTILLGGLAGWIASIVMRRDAEQGMIINIAVGIVGAFLANVLIAPLIGVPAVLDQITIWGFVMAVVGAIVLLAIVNLVTRRSIR